MKLRVWHIPQIPGKPFYVYVEDLKEAVLILDTLARYDTFQYENNIKPDYSNASGLEVFETGEWTDWYDEDGEDVNTSELTINFWFINRKESPVNLESNPYW